MEYDKYNDKGLELDIETHTYKYQGVTLKSVTTLLDEYKTDFDEEEMSTRIAERTKRTKQEVLLEWSSKNEYSQKIGNSLHRYAECKLKGLEIEEPLDDKDVTLRLVLDDYFKDHANLLPVGSELRLVLPIFNIAGTIDLIMISKENNKVFLYDFKTCKEISTKNYKKKLKYPLDYIDDCNFNNYSLQLSMYMYILYKKYKILIDGCYIIHVTTNGYKEFKCNNYMNECEVLLYYNLLKRKDLLLSSESVP